MSTTPISLIILNAVENVSPELPFRSNTNGVENRQSQKLIIGIIIIIIIDCTSNVGILYIYVYSIFLAHLFTIDKMKKPGLRIMTNSSALIGKPASVSICLLD